MKASTLEPVPGKGIAPEGSALQSHDTRLVQMMTDRVPHEMGYGRHRSLEFGSTKGPYGRRGIGAAHADPERRYWDIVKVYCVAHPVKGWLKQYAGKVLFPG